MIVRNVVLEKIGNYNGKISVNLSEFGFSGEKGLLLLLLLGI